MSEFLHVLVITGQIVWLVIIFGLIVILMIPNGPAWGGRKLSESRFMHVYFYVVIFLSSIAAFWFPPFFR